MTGSAGFSGYVAASRANRLEAWRQDHYGMAGRGDGGPKLRLMAAPRELAAGGDAATRAWEIAAAGGAHGGAYRLGTGWAWLGIVDGAEHGTAGATMLTIEADGRRFAERYGAAGDAWSDLDRATAEATAQDEAPTPAQFLALLGIGPEPALEPVRIPLPWVPAEPDAWQPNADLLAGLLSEPAAVLGPVLEPEPVAPATRPGRWVRVRRWAVRQLDALMAGALEIRPQLVRLEMTPAGNGE